MPEKALDLSPFFVGMTLKLEKLGDEDDSYQLTIEHASGVWLKLRLHVDEMDAFINSMTEIAKDA
ncbi:Hypothetical protein A7982_04211 [Minicystis rosea]|nr:Hypothetical protein A7982_04211 [Minicystis rosea]